MGLKDILVFAGLAGLLRLGMYGRWRSWLLLAVSALAVYWLQPLSPVRYLDFWLPTLTLILVGLSWLVTTPPGQRGGRENWTATTVLAGIAITVALTRYLGLDGPLTASRPPQVEQVALALAGVGLLALLLARFGRQASSLYTVSILILLALFLVLKIPALSQWASAGLRGLGGQSTEMATAGDLRWLGYSYIAFRLIHTLRDRQTGRLPAVSLQEYLIYVIFFPSLTAGPIDRLERFIKDLRKPDDPAAGDFSQAGQRLVVGMFKKFVLADALALAALNPLNAGQVRLAGWAWVMLYAYALQIYFDFSGYTDIAIGLGRILGIRLPENFNHPYLKPNLTQFWNNWHMTLTQWFRAYFFNPITRSLRRASRPFSAWLTILITQVGTMLLIGLWHGVTANFVLWGAWHGLGLFIHNRWAEWSRPRLAGLETRPRLKKAVTILGTILTFNYVALGWVWFVLPFPRDALGFFARLFGG